MTTPTAPLTLDAAPEQAWKCGNEFLPYHPSASHVDPRYRDGWNACYQSALSAQAATIAQLEARLREAEAKAADYDRLASIARNRRMVLEEIAGSKPLTATPQQFAGHLQRLARKAVNDYSFAGNDDDAAIAAHGKDGAHDR